MWRTIKRCDKTFLTVLGDVRIRRRIQRCGGCGAWRAAEDELLDMVRTGFSPGVRRIMARTAEEMPFDKARMVMWELARIRVTAKDVERKAEEIGAHIHQLSDERRREVFSGAARPEAAVDGEDGGKAPEVLYVAADGTGVPVVKPETEGRKGKGSDGMARTREAKLGAVFTQTGVNEKGEPVRDPASTSYIGRIESVEIFGSRLYAEAVRRGMHLARRVVVIGDGAVWIWNLAQLHFPGALQIVDYYHAAEHLWQLARVLFRQDDGLRKVWCDRMKDSLWAGDIEQLIGKLLAMPLTGADKQARDKEVAYYETNKERMRYATFRAKGLFIGSGVIEAGCKSLVGQRLKRSGMRWTVNGANAILALRCCVASGRFEDYWEDRRAA